MKENFDAIVIGGGIIGCAIAYELSKKSYKDPDFFSCR